MDNEKIIRSLRLQLLVERLIIAVIALTLLTTWGVARYKSGKSVIIVDGKAIACVPSQQDAEVVLSEIKSSAGCNPSEVEFQQDVRVARAPRDAEPVSRHRALCEIRRVVCALAPRWSIIVDGKPAVALPDKKTAGDTLELAKMKFGSMVKNLAEEPQFKQKVSVDIAAVPLRICCKTAQEAVDMLFSDQPAVKTDAVYTVENGDMAVSIARKNGISLEELEKLNPGVKLERLQIGDKLNIKAAKSAGARLTVVVRDLTESVETVPAPVQQITSASLRVGKSKLLSPGRSGERRVQKATVFENGTEVGTEIISEEMIREPSPRRIAQGIKNR